MQEGYRFISKSIVETAQIAKEILQILEKKNASGAFVLALSGDLGVGKTAITKEIGKILKVKETIQSPTFVIMKVYNTIHDFFKKMIHIDAYRIEKEEELKVLNLDHIFLEKNTLVVIEWPENFKNRIPKDALFVSIKNISEKEREFKIL